MGNSMKIFTFSSGVVKEGADVVIYRSSSGSKVPAIVVGEHGRGRKLGILPVFWRDRTIRSGVINSGLIGFFQLGYLGRPRMLEQDRVNSDECIIVIRAHIGYRGSNNMEVITGSAKKLVVGKIAQGAAGRMGWGGQWIVRVQPNTTIHLTYSGHLYGGLLGHYIKWDGQKIIVVSEEEYNLVGL